MSQMRTAGRRSAKQLEQQSHRNSPDRIKRIPHLALQVVPQVPRNGFALEKPETQFLVERCVKGRKTVRRQRGSRKPSAARFLYQRCYQASAETFSLPSRQDIHFPNVKKTLHEISSRIAYRSAILVTCDIKQAVIEISTQLVVATRGWDTADRSSVPESFERGQLYGL